MTRRLPTDLRARLTLAVGTIMLIALIVLTAAGNAALRRSLDHDARAILRDRGAAVLSTLVTDPDEGRVGEGPDEEAVESLAWVFVNGRVVERPAASPSFQRFADSLEGGEGGFLEAPDTDVLFHVLPVLDGDLRTGTVVVGLSLVPYERTADRALAASVVFAALILLLVTLSVRWVVGRSLRPVARMTTEADEWSEHDLDRRFAAGEPYDELTRLAATFDGMLDRMAASLRREQRFSAEVSHELRTPLAGILAEAEVALRRERSPEAQRATLEQVSRIAERMSRTLEALISVSRAEPGVPRGTCDLAEAVAAAVESCTSLAEGQGVEMEVLSATGVRAGADADVVERILAPVVENACRYARSRVTVALNRDAEGVTAEVRDDGPGVTDADRELIFEPGTRARDADEGGSGAGLGLALARRLARAVDGDVRCLPADHGAIFAVTLPSG